ncbi:MAG TPA: ribosome silencing factor [Burkholderiaceae bacterium]|jgi:ribosome-associated protein|nr:ribosome silencing factor [Burkholderiaceae bacterium]
MDLRKLQRVVVDALEDVKAQNINVYNTVGVSDMFDRVVLASGTSNRQTRALAYHVAEKVKDAGGKVVSIEGAENGEWVLVDLGDLVVHVMQPQIRAYYALEEIWGAKPVAVKLAEPAVKRIAQRAAGAAAAAGKAAKKPAAKKTAPRKSAAQKPAATHRAAKRPAARKPAAKKQAAKSARRRAG